MEQQFVVTHQYTIYGRWEKNLILDRPTLKYVRYENIRRSHFLVDIKF